MKLRRRWQRWIARLCARPARKPEGAHMKTLPVTPYKVIRARIWEGDVVLCRDRSLLSKIIRVVGQSRWSHVALLDKFHGRVILYESRFPRGRMMPLSDWLKERHGQVYVGRCCQLTTDNCQLACSWALDAHYRPYAWRDLVKYAVWRATVACGLPGWWPGRRDNTHLLVCSELVGLALQFGGCDVPQVGPMLTPADIAAIVTIKWRLK